MSCAWLCLVLLVLCVGARDLAGDASPRGLQFSGTEHASVRGFSGFPVQSSISVVFSLLAASTTEDGLASAASHSGTLLSVWSQSSKSLSFAISNPGNVAVQLGSSAPIRTGLGLADGGWHRVAVVIDRSQPVVRLVVDGRLAFRSAIPHNTWSEVFNGPSSLVLGQLQRCDGGCFDPSAGLVARLRELSIWSHPITLQEADQYSRGVDTSSAPPTLVAYYPMTTPTGTTVMDSGPQALHADMEAVSVVGGGAHSAFYFDGSQFISRQLEHRFPAQMLTVALWVQVPSTVQLQDGHVIFSYATEDDTQSVMLSHPAALQISLYFVSFQTTVSIADSQWHHVVVTCDSIGLVTLYVDGTSRFSHSLPKPMLLDQSGWIVLGQMQGCVGGCFVASAGYRGFLGGVKVWASSLTLDLINAERAVTRPGLSVADRTRPGDQLLVLSWDADAARNGVVVDQGNNHLNGSLGVPQWITPCPHMCSYPRGHCGYDGVCECEAGAWGEDCSRGCLDDCNNHGICVEGQCHCYPMFTGITCDTIRDVSLRESWQCVGPDLTASHFNYCSSISHPISEQAFVNIKRLEGEAQKAAEHMQQDCANSTYGRKMIREVACGAIFAPCKNQQLNGVCSAMCNAMSNRCGFNATLMCSLSAFDKSSSPDCYAHWPVEEPCDCHSCCSHRGTCSNGVCQCNEGFAGSACEQDLCLDAHVPLPPPSFCSMVNYKVSRSVNLTKADQIAQVAFAMASPFCPASSEGLQLMKTTLCAASHLRCTSSGTTRPCRTMCTRYGTLCGIADQMTCFSDFYADGPDCFDVFASSSPSPSPSVGSLASTHPSICPTNFTCSEHGTCINGSCVCFETVIESSTGTHHTWGGIRCDTAMPTCPNRCSNHGVCANGVCRCLAGWYSSDCSRRVEELCDESCLRSGLRPEQCCVSPDAAARDEHARRVSLCGEDFSCNGRGQCVNQSVCVCNPGYTGKACSVLSAGSMCPWECSGHGQCVQSPDTLQPPFSTSAAILTTCVCEMGWEGMGCEIAIACANNCSGHGSCNYGVCVCDPPTNTTSEWMGLDCGLPAPRCGIDFNCRNGGLCINKQCRCRSGWTGHDCGQHDPTYAVCGISYQCSPLHSTGCDPASGVCACQANFAGVSCDVDMLPLGSSAIGLATGGALRVAGLLHIPDVPCALVPSVDGTALIEDRRCISRRRSAGATPVTFKDTTKPFTIEMWFYALQSAVGPLVSKSGEYAVSFQGQGAALAVTDGTAQLQTDFTDFVLNRWYHIAAVFDAAGSRVRVYVDGAPSGDGPMTSSRPGGNWDLVIGGSFVGYLGELRIWSQARTLSQVRLGMHGRVALPNADLAGYWRFETAASIATDSTRKSVDAVPVGALKWTRFGPQLAGKSPLAQTVAENPRELSRLSCGQLCAPTITSITTTTTTATTNITVTTATPSSSCMWKQFTPKAVTNNICSSSLTNCVSLSYTAARAQCHRLSARLCTASEISSFSTTESQGCNYDTGTQSLWTSTVCSSADAQGPFQGVYVQPAPRAGQSVMPAVCMRSTSSLTLPVRCCADKDTSIPTMPEFPTSCRDALARSFRTTSGKTGSGEYSILPDPSTGTVYQVYCEQAIGGGGWTLVANVPNTATFPKLTTPTTRASSYQESEYATSHWNHDSSYKISYSFDTTSDQVLFASGDGTVWCVMRLSDIQLQQAVVIDSVGTSAGARDLTALSQNGTLWITCARVGDVEAPVMWTGNSSNPHPSTSFYASLHNGVGMFVSSGHVAPPAPPPPPPPYAIAYGRSEPNAGHCAQVTATEIRSNNTGVLVSVVSNNTHLVADPPLVLGSSSYPYSSHRVCHRTASLLHWIIWQETAPNTMSGDVTILRMAEGQGKCVVVRFAKSFHSRPLIQLSAQSPDIVRVWAQGVGIGGFYACAMLGSNASFAQLSYVAYDRVPGPGGVSDHVHITPQANTSTVCMQAELPYRFASAAIVVLTVELLQVTDNAPIVVAPTVWLLQTNTTSFSYCVNNPTSSAVQLNWIAMGSKGAPPPRDLTPSSCVEARRMGWRNTAGDTDTGEYRLKNTNEDSSSMYILVHCDMNVAGGSGWALVGNVPAGKPFLPSLGQGPNALSLAASVSPLSYNSSSWNHQNSYWVAPSKGIAPNSRVLFVTGDYQVWCMMSLDVIRAWHPIGESASTPILASQNTARTTGGLTSITNEPESRGSRFMIACEGEFPENMKKVLWAHSAPPEWSCFKDSHKGVGVFVQ